MRNSAKINSVKNYISQLHKVLRGTKVMLCTDSPFRSKRVVVLDEGIGILIGVLREHIFGLRKKIMIIGNGGSAAIAIHMIMDYVNAGKMRTIDFMSPALLTCMANDNGYENVFAKPIGLFADTGDVLFAISSSGKSLNIIKACQSAKDRGCVIVTFSGFSPSNPLRKLGYLNFYLPSSHFGHVELSHEILLHCILDLFIETKIETAS